MESAGKNDVTHHSVRVKISEIDYLRRCKSGVTTWLLVVASASGAAMLMAATKEQTRTISSRNIVKGIVARRAVICGTTARGQASDDGTACGRGFGSVWSLQS
jgi:hypothetical protein